MRNTFFFIILSFLGIFAILMVRKGLRFLYAPKPIAHRPGIKKETKDSDSSRKQFVPELIGLMEVESFFLNLYRRQLGSALEAPGLITSTPVTHNRPGRTYKLSIRHKGEWISRHMTLGPIGELTHSKSQCFYVIFDTHIVVKIPPVPIKDFTDYSRRIRFENALVNKLTPRLCIIPNVSVIMTRIHRFPGTIPPDQIEEKYIRFLNAAPEYQTCLKVGGSFAFFMDLSRHFFLSHVLSDLHDVTEEIDSAIVSDTALLLQGFDFDAKYGPQSSHICSALQELYGLFESGLATSVLQPNEQLQIGDKEKREWFSAHLAEKPIPRPSLSEISERSMAETAKLLRSLIPVKGKTVTAYKQLVSDYATRLVFNRNRPQMETIVTNLLDLLAWLNEKRIALRDLKPDNLLIAGKPENYPLFLLSPNEYRIGLIDLETAVDFEPDRNKAPVQPLMGGTPAYATPSHFALNTLLQDVYGDLPRILHLQDWYAVVGIIFEVIAGNRLFTLTGCRIPGIIQLLQQTRSDPPKLKTAFLATNAEFWEKARAEFVWKMKKNEPRLSKVAVNLPHPFRRLLSRELGLLKQRSEPFAEALVDLDLTLSAKELLEQMFTIISDAMDLPEPLRSETNPIKAMVPPMVTDLESATCSIGYTLTSEA